MNYYFVVLILQYLYKKILFDQFFLKFLDLKHFFFFHGELNRGVEGQAI